MNILNSVELARERALGFEEEYAKAIEELHKKEEIARQLTQLRMDWFASETSTSVLENEVFKRKIALLQIRGDIVKTKSIVDKYRLEGYYETQQLKQLIAATKPGSKGDVGGKIRSREMEEVMKEGSEVLTKALQESIMFRQNLLSESTSISNQLDGVMKERDHRAEKYSHLLDESLSQFTSGVEDTYQACEKNCRKVTEQYLVLRHNSRIATELITRSQNESALERKRLQDAIAECRTMASERISAAEESYRKELETKLQLLRSEVMDFEVTLEGKWQRNDEVRREWKKTLTTVKSDIKYYNEKYQKLQLRRYHEINVIQAELDGLRDDIENAEMTLLDPNNKLKKHLRESVMNIKLKKSPGKQSEVRQSCDGITADEGLLLESLQRRVKDLKFKLGDDSRRVDFADDEEEKVV
jgi:hypothetical protein